jgi:hypothetical protein
MLRLSPRRRQPGIPPPKDPDFISPVGIGQPRLKPVVVAVQGATNTVGHELFLAADEACAKAGLDQIRERLK